MTDNDELQREPIPPDVARADPEPSVDTERRVAIAKLGMLAAYTAPALLASMIAQPQAKAGS